MWLHVIVPDCSQSKVTHFFVMDCFLLIWKALVMAIFSGRQSSSPKLRCQDWTMVNDGKCIYICVYSVYIYIIIYIFWLVADLPLWKIWKSVGMMTFPIYGKITFTYVIPHSLQPLTFPKLYILLLGRFLSSFTTHCLFRWGLSFLVDWWIWIPIIIQPDKPRYVKGSMTTALIINMGLAATAQILDEVIPFISAWYHRLCCWSHRFWSLHPYEPMLNHISDG